MVNLIVRSHSDFCISKDKKNAFIYKTVYCGPTITQPPAVETYKNILLKYK